MGYYKLCPARYVTKFLALLFKDVRGNDVFVCFINKEKSFGFQDIAINMKLLTKYVTPDTLPK